MFYCQNAALSLCMCLHLIYINFLFSSIIFCHDLCDQYVCTVAEGTQHARLRCSVIRQEATCRTSGGSWVEVVAHNSGETNKNKTPFIEHTVVQRNTSDSGLLYLMQSDRMWFWVKNFVLQCQVLGKCHLMFIPSDFISTVCLRQTLLVMYITIFGEKWLSDLQRTNCMQMT